MEMLELYRLSWVQTVNLENTKVFQTSALLGQSHSEFPESLA